MGCRIELKILLSRGTIEKRIFETIQKHFATAVIRTFLGNLFYTKALGENAPRIVFTIPREELHEMGALLAADRRSGLGRRLSKVVILASMAQFIQHLGTVYGLTDFFRNNPGEIQIP
jgi:hypothetical protein